MLARQVGTLPLEPLCQLFKKFLCKLLLVYNRAGGLAQMAKSLSTKSI
jgi:hypothetical protein